MNKQKAPKGIEWSRVYGRPGYTWNPVAGCPHGCQWEMPNGEMAICYAKEVAEGLAQSAYPHGFEHHYWKPNKLDEPLKLKTPAGIFLDSMSDLMAYWVTDEQIRAVLEVVQAADHHIFFLLTKNAPRLLKFTSEFPPNLWIGASMPPTVFRGNILSPEQQERMFAKTLSVLKQIDVPVKWVSFEPLSFDVSSEVRFFPTAINWAVIGAASNGRQTFQPDPNHVERLLEVLDRNQIPTFFKGNLAWSPWREEFPEVINA